MAHRLGRILVRLLQAFALLASLHFVGVNVFLNSDWLLSKLNRRPDRLSLGYGHAWCLWPGVVHVRGFELRAQTRDVRWSVSLAEARVRVHLTDLWKREFHALSVRGRTAAFALERRAVPGEASAAAPPAQASAAAGPDMPPAAGASAATGGAEQPPAAAERHPWTVRLDDIELAELNHIRMQDYRFEGEARIWGSLRVRPRQDLQVGPALVEFDSGRVHLDGQPVIESVSGLLQCTADRFDPQKLRGLQVLSAFRVHAGIDAVVRDLRFLGYYLRKASWLKLEQGAGTLHADVRVDRGVFLPGTRLEAASQSIGAAIPDYRISGAGRVRALVQQGSGAPPHADIELEFVDYRMQREGEAQSHIHGKGLRIEASSPDLSILEPFDELDLRMHLARADVPDLSYYNSYLPNKLGLHIRRGRGWIESRFSASTLSKRASGRIDLNARGVQGRYEDLRLSGNWDLRTRLTSGNLEQMRFDVSGSSFAVDGVEVVDTADAKQKPSQGWWAGVVLDRAILEPRRPKVLDAVVRIEMRDAQPLLRLYGAKEDLPGWVRKIFGEKRLKASGRVVVGQDLLEIGNLEIRAKSIEILAQLRVRAGHKQGALYASYGPLSVGIEILGAKTKLHLFRPKNWYKKYKLDP